jgi:two-component system OmpR family response regulator
LEITPLLCRRREDRYVSDSLPRVLVVDEDPRVRDMLQRGLADDGYTIDLARDGDDALGHAMTREYDAIVLDLMLPGIDGYEVCRRLRAAERWAPVLMLSARTQVSDCVRGLDSGADDYLLKPLGLEELSARLRALRRRPLRARPTILQAGDLTLNPASRVVMRGRVQILVSTREFALLEFLMRHVGEVLTRDAIFQHVWNHPGFSGSNVVDQYVSYVRRRIDRPFGVSQLETLRGVGYRLRSAPTSENPYQADGGKAGVGRLDVGRAPCGAADQTLVRADVGDGHLGGCR